MGVLELLRHLGKPGHPSAQAEEAGGPPLAHVLHQPLLFELLIQPVVHGFAPLLDHIQLRARLDLFELVVQHLH